MSLYKDLRSEGLEAQRHFVEVRRSQDRAVVVLNEPDRMNALSAPMVAHLKEAITELVGDDDIRSVVLTGAGDAFSAGGDVHMMRRTASELGDEGTADVWRWIRYQFGGVARLIARSDTTFIAALNGPAAGVGLAWALSCDVVIASERAVIVPAFGRLGLLPEVGTSWALTRALGYQGAFAYFVEGRHLSAAEGLRLGLVQEVVPHEQLLPAADRWCSLIAALPPHAVAMCKPLLRAAADASWDAAIVMEEFAEPTGFTTGAFQRAIHDFGVTGAGD